MAMSPHVKRLREALGAELLVLPSVTGVVYDASGRVLLVRQVESGLWTAPGGAIDPNERPADAVVREVWEETGLDTEPVRILGVHGGPSCMVVYPNGDRTTYVMTVFECTVRGGTPRPDLEEISEVAFVGRDELERYPTSPWVGHVLPRLYDRSGAGYFEPATWRPPR